MSLAGKILAFLQHLQPPMVLPAGVEVLHPLANDETMSICKMFYKKFYNDNQPRYCIIGINPGRFGGGVTGIPFTDPKRLKHECGIDNSWPAKQELSSLFVYDVINAYGGATKFYGKFYVTAVSPLGFTKHGKNLNYYDDKELLQSINPFVIDCLEKQLAWGLHTSTALCLGEGENYKYLSKLNSAHNFFNEIIPLPHPRFIMQYKLRTKESFVEKYLKALSL